jgi:hypothetical protein
VQKLFTEHRLYTADIAALYDICNSEEFRAQLVHLQSPILFDNMIKFLFDYNKSVELTILEKAVFVLVQISTANPNGAEVEAQEKQEWIQALTKVCKVCQDKSFGLKMGEVLPAIRENLSNPLVSAVVIHWVQITLLDINYYETSYHTQVTPVLLMLLCNIATRHILQREAVFDVLLKVFLLKSNLESLQLLSFQGLLIKSFIHLIHCGTMREVFGMMEEHVERIDLSLIRSFVTMLMETTGGPYSPHFLRSLGSILLKTTVAQALKSNETSRKLAHKIMQLYVDTPLHSALRTKWIEETGM